MGHKFSILLLVFPLTRPAQYRYESALRLLPSRFVLSDEQSFDNCEIYARFPPSSPLLLDIFLDMPSHLPVDEAHNDFYRLPSNPRTIFRTGPAWKLPTGPWGQRKEARPCFNHAIALVWHRLGKQIYEYFDSIDLKWTSIDPVYFAEAGEFPGPLFLWVGVMPKTLSRDDAEVAARRCKDILAEYEIMDVEIALRESIFSRFTRPRLLDHVSSIIDPTADVRSPFTPTLGLQIASKAHPYIEGTGCLYLRESSHSDRVFLLTARHVVLPTGKHSNQLYHRENNTIPRLEVIHLGSRAYQNALSAMESRIDHATIVSKYCATAIGRLGPATDGEDLSISTRRKTYEAEMAKEEAVKSSTDELHSRITKHWTVERQRTLGHVVYAPPISANAGGGSFTEDWALVELDRSKFDWSTFPGNVIGLETKHEADEFTRKMYPYLDSHAQFDYPGGGLMYLRDFVRDDELRHPTTLDENGLVCLVVIKNGAGTGLTFGRAAGIGSFTRTYQGYNIDSTSMEIAIYPYSHKDGAFAAPGDSGAVVADANNRIVGMITGGTGGNDSTDVAYATPYYFLDDRVKSSFPDSYLYPAPA